MSTNKRCLNCGKGLIHFLDTANGNRGLCQICLLQDNLRAKREAEQMTVDFNKETVLPDIHHLKSVVLRHGQING